MNRKTKYLVHAALIAAVYAALTLLPFLQPFSFGPLQLRVAEALTVLPYFTPAAIPGLFLGCLVSNLFSPVGVWDILFGSLATLLGAFGTYALRKHKLLAPLPPVLANGVIVGGLLFVMLFHTSDRAPLWLMMAQVAGGELLACYGLGLPLLMALEKNKTIFK